MPDPDAALHRHHERSAERVFAAVVRLQGLMIKIGQTIGSYPALFPPEYIRVLSRLQQQILPRRLPQSQSNQLRRDR